MKKECEKTQTHTNGKETMRFEVEKKERSNTKLVRNKDFFRLERSSLFSFIFFVFLFTCLWLIRLWIVYVFLCYLCLQIASMEHSFGVYTVQWSFDAVHKSNGEFFSVKTISIREKTYNVSIFCLINVLTASIQDQFFVGLLQVSSLHCRPPTNGLFDGKL